MRLKVSSILGNTSRLLAPTMMVTLRAEWESDSPPNQFRRRSQPRVDASTPLMAPHQLPLVVTPLSDIVCDTAGMDRFSAFY